MGMEGKDPCNDKMSEETQQPLLPHTFAGGEREEKKKGTWRTGSAYTSAFSRRPSFALVRLDSTWTNGMLSAPSPRSLGTADARIPS